MDDLMAKRRNRTFASHSDYFVNIKWCNWFVGHIVYDHLAVTSRINHEICDEDHGTASLEISLSLITSMTQYKVEVPRITGHSDISGSSITEVTWSSSYPWTQGTLTFIKTNPIGSTRLPPIPLIRGTCPPIS